ncbi:MAG: tetratricopeptide repeat protein [Phycisphaerales bacterium]
MSETATETQPETEASVAPEDAPATGETPSGSEPPERQDPVEAVRSGWRGLWQVPTLLAAGALLVGGIAYSIANKPDPTFDGALTRAESLIDRDEHQAAIRVLNERVFSFLSTTPDDVPIQTRRKYHTLVARAIYEGQEELGLDVAENHESIVREYLRAEKAGETLGPIDVHHLAMTYVNQGEHALALARAKALPADRRELRAEIERRVVDAWMRSPVSYEGEAIGLLTDMLADPALGDEDRVWALARRADVQMSQGAADQAIERLLPAVPRIDAGSDPRGAAQLHLKLAEAYLAAGAPREAETHANRVLDLVGPDDPSVPFALLALGQVHEARGDLSEARDVYAAIDEDFGGTPAYGGALLGLGETLAGLNSIDASFEAYERLVNYLTGVPRPEGGPTIERVAESLLDRYLDLTTVWNFEPALRFAALASSLYESGEEPPSVIRAIAEGHRLSAEALMGEPSGDGGRSLSDAERSRVLASMDASTRAETQRHLLRSGAHYRSLAERFALDDDEAYADALWQAATQFDRSGQLERAQEAYRAFATGVPSDPRTAEARFRLGQAFQSQGDYETASGYYEGLVADLQTGARREVGPFGVRSFVPLAQCYLLDTDETNDSQARGLLESALSGAVGTAETEQYRDALVELGTLYHRAGEFERAIERFDEALARYPESDETGAVRFRLADAQRQLADEIEGSLEGPMPDSERQARREQIIRLRHEAIDGFRGVTDYFDRRDPASLTELDELHRRNSLFYMGDCAFDLGAYEEAIAHYDAARERYPDDPASLVAMVQIVSAYVEQGDLQRAQTANERARRFFMSLPEEVWDDPSLPMDRADWERWLESSAQLYETASGEE